MDNLYKNKKLIFICLSLIIITFLIYIFNVGNNVDEEEKIEYEYLKHYETNHVIPVYITEEDVVKIYLNEYKNNMIESVEDAFNSLNEAYRLKRFSNLENYKVYVDSILSSATYSMEIDRYSVSNVSGKKVFNVYDKSGYQYLIKEISIMNYEVYLDEYTVTIK